jgi:hypothetical protein
MDLWQHKKRSGPERWHTRETGGDTEACAPVRNGIIRRIGDEKRGRGRPNLIWEESMKRDLKDWSITKELTLDRREWKLAIHVTKPWSSVPSLLLPFCQSFFPFYSPLFKKICLVFYSLFSFSRFDFLSSFFVALLSLFFGSRDFISSLP